MDEERKEERIRLIQEISEISGELKKFTHIPVDQFVAFVSEENESGDLGGLSKNFPDPASSLTLLDKRELVSIDFSNGKTQKHVVPIRSIKGNGLGSFRSLGVLLEDGTFLVGGGLAYEQRYCKDQLEQDTSSALREDGEPVSVDLKAEETQKHPLPIVSPKNCSESEITGTILNDGALLLEDNSIYERKGRGNLRKFANLSNVKIKKISAGSDHFLMLSEDGRVFSLLTKDKSADNDGQLGTGDQQNYYEPIEIKGIPKISKIRAGENSSSFIDERRNLWICGRGSGYFPFHKAFMKPYKIASGVLNVFSGFGSNTTFIQKTNGKILAGGRNWNGECGVGSRISDDYIPDESSSDESSSDDYDSDDYDSDGYNYYGYDRDGYDCDGYNHRGYDRDGYDHRGYNHDGYDRNGYDRDGYDHRGYNHDGYDRDGYYINGYHRYSGISEWTEIEFEGDNPLERSELKKISCSWGASFLLLEDGTVYSCGRKDENGFDEGKTKFTKLETFEERGERILDFACGAYISVFLADSGQIYMVGDSKNDSVRDTLKLFGKTLENSNDEQIWEVVWQNESDREKLNRKISEGTKFKISIWQEDDTHIFITERVGKKIIEESQIFENLKEKLDEKMIELSADFTKKMKEIFRKKVKENEEIIREKVKENEEITSEYKRLEKEINKVNSEKKKLEDKIRRIEETVTKTKKENAEIILRNKRLHERINEMDSERMEYEKKIREMHKEIQLNIRRLRDMSEIIEKKHKEIIKLQKRPPEAPNTPETLTLLRSFDAFLTPIKSVKQLEDFLHFFDFSDDRRQDEIFELYKDPKAPQEFESRDQRAAVEKISGILRVYKVLKESPRAKAHFEYPGGERGIKFELIDKVYREFFECLRISGNTGDTPNQFPYLYSFFKYFGVLDFDLNSLTLFISSLSDSLESEVQNLRQKIEKGAKGPEKSASKVPSYTPTLEDPLQKYIDSFGDDIAFFEKFSFLVLEILRRFVASLSEELSNRKTQRLLSDAILKITQDHWHDLESRKESENSEQRRILKYLKSLHGDMVVMYKNAAATRRKRYFKQLRTIQGSLQIALVALLSRKISESKPSDEALVEELSTVFKTLGIIKGTPKSEEVIEILESDFDFELGELWEQLSEVPERSAIAKGFSIIGFQNAKMAKRELFYDAAGNLKEEYSKIPKIETYRGRAIRIFIKFYTERKIPPESIQVKLVHLFTGKSFTLNFLGCRNSDFFSIKEIWQHNTFQITILDLKYSGEFALAITLLSDAGSPQTFFHRGIFNIFPREARHQDF